VESEIRRGCVRLGLVDQEAGLELEVASRTDAGVHARANVLTLEVDLPGPKLLRALNSVAPDLWFTHAAPVAREFRVRSAQRRWYRYLEPDPIGRRADWYAAARPFRGPVDVRSFARGLPPGVPCVRDLEPIRLHFSRGMLVLDIRGRSFVWGMVRKIVAALRAHAAGTLSVDAIGAAVRGERRLTLSYAEPERLILWEVRHGIRWTVRADQGTRSQALRFVRETQAVRVRTELLGSLAPWPRPRR
jgi:tRNA pseudouridine38-40 synthase